MVRLATPTDHFHYASRFATQSLAHMLDSLVRVSRRDGWKHSVSIASRQVVGRMRPRGTDGTASCPTHPPGPDPPLPRLAPAADRSIPQWEEGGICAGLRPGMAARRLPPWHLAHTIIPPSPLMLTHPPPKCPPGQPTGTGRREPQGTPRRTSLEDRPRGEPTAGTYCLQSLPFWQFQALLTLFSKFFASFTHGTCSLSVSHHYLALEGIYLPL
jgi:hypothetical protein